MFRHVEDFGSGLEAKCGVLTMVPAEDMLETQLKQCISLTREIWIS